MGEGTEATAASGPPETLGEPCREEPAGLTPNGNMAYEAVKTEDVIPPELDKMEESTRTEVTLVFDGESATYKALKNGEIGEEKEDDVMVISNGDVEKTQPMKTRNVSVSSTTVRVYRRRWFMLGLFCLLSMSNAFQWIQYSVIGNVIVDYYDVKYIAVDWMSMIYMLVYIPLIFPVTWLLERAGLKVIGVLGASLNCAGSWFRYAGSVPHLFGVAFFGQTLCAIGQVFILGMPAHVAATWFGANEVSTACAIGVFGNQLGGALGFVLPPILVPPEGDVQKNMNIMFLGTACVTSVLLFFILTVYKDEPPLPPSKAKYDSQKSAEERSYKESIVSLFKNVPFVLLLITYGINVGSFYAISTLLNQIILSEFEDEEVMVGIIGLALIIAGMVGSVITGFWLDRTRTYRGTTIFVYIMSLVGMICFTFCLKLNEIWIMFAVSIVLGYFMTGYLPLGFEFAAELTFPEPEGTSSGLLNASAQSFGIIFTLTMGALVNDVSSLWANIFLCIALFIGSIITMFIKAELKRQNAEREGIPVMIPVEGDKVDPGLTRNRISSVRFEGIDAEEEEEKKIGLREETIPEVDGLSQEPISEAPDANTKSSFHI